MRWKLVPMAEEVYIALRIMCAMISGMCVAIDIELSSDGHHVPGSLYLFAILFEALFVAIVALFAWFAIRCEWSESSWVQFLCYVFFAVALTLPVLIWAVWRTLA